MHKQGFCYNIHVQFHISKDWLFALPAAQMAHCTNIDGKSVTAITLWVQDQAELMGVLNEIHGNNMRLLSVSDVTFLNTDAQSSAEERDHGL